MAASLTTSFILRVRTSIQRARKMKAVGCVKEALVPVALDAAGLRELRKCLSPEEWYCVEPHEPDVELAR